MQDFLHNVLPHGAEDSPRVLQSTGFFGGKARLTSFEAMTVPEEPEDLSAEMELTQLLRDAAKGLEVTPESRVHKSPSNGADAAADLEMLHASPPCQRQHMVVHAPTSTTAELENYILTDLPFPRSPAASEVMMHP